MKYTILQENIFKFINEQDDNGSIIAGPGSGKTTSIVEATRFFKGGTIFLGSFGRAIADTLNEKVKPYNIFGNIESNTLNSLGNRALKNKIGYVKPNKFKDYNLLANSIGEEAKEIRYPLDRMIGIMKNNILIDPTEEEVKEIIKEHAIDIPEKWEKDFTGILITIYNQSVNSYSNEISFDDQKFLPIAHNWSIPKYDNGLIDESQDLSPLEMELIRRSIKRPSFFGDPYQCQPEGTKILIINHYNEIEQIPIEQLQKFQKVVSWNKSWRGWSKDKYVKEIAWRPYEGELINITTENGLTTKVTPNHKCIVNFARLKEYYAVYLMMRGSNFRIGKCKLNYGANGAGILQRLRSEKADKIWILDIKETSKEAFLQEQYLSHKYNIPQLTFTPSNVSLLDQKDINIFYLLIGNNIENGIKILNDFGRDIKYPLYTSKNTNAWNEGFTRPLITQACNLMDNCLVLPYTNSPDGKTWSCDWQKIKISRENYKGKVYSLSIHENETYIADGILVSNSIYMFKGSMPDAMDQIHQVFNTTILPLTICFRCPEKIIQEAKKYNPNIQSPTEYGLKNMKGEGTIDTINIDVARSMWNFGDYVLCRTTVPLIRECLKILPYKKAFVKGRDIGEGLIRLIDLVTMKNDYMSIKEFSDRLEGYYQEQKARLMSLNREEAATELDDKVDSVKIFSESVDNVGKLKNTINQVITDNGIGVCFMTMHKAKGLENENVYILREGYPSKRAKRPAQKQQERNLMFVSITRGMNKLFYVEQGQ